MAADTAPAADAAYRSVDVDTPGDRKILADRKLAELLAAQDDAEHRDKMCTCCSTICAVTGLLMVGGGVLQVLGRVGYVQFNNITAIALVALAGTSFMVFAAVLAQWHPSAVLGNTLVHRVTHTRSNWETDTVRSFCEVGIWLSVIWATFQKSGGGLGGLLLALICSTGAGCLLAIMGDALTQPLRALENYHRSPVPSPSHGKGLKTDDLCLTPGSMMLLMLYGHGAIQVIYQYCADICVASFLASAAGLCLLLLSKLIQCWPPMRHAGATLQARITDTLQNWRKFPVRSAIESTFWSGTVFCTYACSGNVMQALQVGTVSGIVIILSSELFWHRAEKDTLKNDAEEQPAVAPACIFAYGVFSMIVIFFIQADDWFTAAALSTISGVGFTAAGQLCLRWIQTHSAGMVINGRVMNAATNWNEYPIRSFVETSLFLSCTWWMYATTGSVIFAPMAGFITGCVAVLGNHQIGWGVPSQPSVISPNPPTRSPDRDASAGIVEGITAMNESSTGAALMSKAATSATAGNDKDASAAGTRGSVVNRHQSFTWDEVAKHTKHDDIWLVINGQVYDVSAWAPSHPGGSIIYKFAGVDASDQFAAFHVPRVAKRLPRFLIGKVTESKVTESKESKENEECSGAVPSTVVTPSAATLEYRALREKLWKEGYFEPQPSYYFAKAGVCVSLMLSSAALVLFLPGQHFVLKCFVAGALLGLGWQQTAFLAHDCSHYGAYKPAAGGGPNWIAWLVSSPMFGISLAMWTEEHSMHHAITLRPREDPQFNYLPIWLISPKELDVPGTTLDSITRALVSIQHYTFLPLVVLIGRFNFHAISFVFAVRKLVIGATTRARWLGLIDVIGMLVYWTWYVGLVAQLDGKWARCFFVLTSNWVCGVLHIQLLLSHLFTQTFTAEEERKEQFFAFQMKTTRNIDAEWWLENWFHGGLEFQIEHHLFPQLPRHNLHRVKPFVQDICRRHGIPYQSVSFSEAFRHMMQNLEQLASAIINCEF